MKLSRFRPALIAFLCGAGFLHADVVVLKDGKRLEGTITAENPTSVHMRYKATAKIWDDKEIPRSDIAEIIKQKPEEVELIELRKELPTRDLMTAEKYESLIQDRVRPFVNRYPGTKEAKEAEDMIAALQAEKEKVVAGGIKVEGKWLTPDEAKAQSYNLKAYEIYAALREKAAAKDYAGALKEFDKMAPPQLNTYGVQNAPQGYTLSIYYPKAVDEVRAVLNSYQGQVDQMIKDQPALQKMRDEGLTKLVEPDLSRTKKAIDKEKEQWQATYTAERKVSRWFTPYKYDLPSLQALATTITSEKARLQTIDTASLSKINAVIGNIMAALPNAGKDPAALQAMGTGIGEGEALLGTLNPQNANYYNSVFQTYRQYYMAYHQQLASRSSQPAASAGSGLAGSSAIGGTNAPAEDARVAAALAAAGGVMQPQQPAAPAQPGVAPAQGAVPAQPGAAQPAPGAMAQPAAQQQPGAAPAQAPVQPGYPAQPGAAVAPATGAVPQAQPGYPAQQQPQAPYAQPVQPMAAPVVAPEPEGMSTTTMLLIGVGVVVLVLVIAMSGGKKKKAA